MTSTAATWADLWTRLVARDPGRPLLTFYDEATGERTELSRATTGNWVAKLAGLLVDELDLERGMTLRVDLPPHWLGPVAMGAAWTTGLVVVDHDEPDAVLCGPGTLGTWADQAGDRVVLASALHPLATRFAVPLPAGVHDLGVEVWSQPDAFAASDPPTGEDPAVDLGGAALTQAQLWQEGAAGDLVPDGGRLLSVANPASPPGLATWVEPLARGGSLVLVVGAGAERLEAIAAAERVTHRSPHDQGRGDPQPPRS